MMAIASYGRSQMNLEIGPWQVIWPHTLVMLGIGLVFAPISVAAYKYIPVHLRAAAVGLLSLLRTEGGSVGTSAAKIIEDRRVQLHLSRIGEGLSPLNHDVRSYLDQGQAYLLQFSGDPAWSKQATLQSLDDLRQQQAWSLSYFDVFFLCAVVSLALVVLVFFMKRSVAEKGERISCGIGDSIAGVTVRLFEIRGFYCHDVKQTERRCTMETTNSLIERIDAEFSAAEQRWDQLRVKQLEAYQVRQQRLERFERTVEDLRELWEPRLEALAKRFGKNMDVLPTQERGRRAVSMEFRSSLARILLRFAVSPDVDARKLVVSYDVEILPVLMKFDSHRELELPLDAVDKSNYLNGSTIES